MKPVPFEDLPAEEREAILSKRLVRAQTALSEAERALEGRMRQLASANDDLRVREEDLAERLDIQSRQLLAAQRTSGFATIFGRTGEAFQSSAQLNDIFGYPAERDLAPPDVISRIHPLDRKRIVAASEEFFSSRTPDLDHVYEHRILHPASGLRWLKWSIRREIGGSGSKTTVYGSVRDITEMRANERRVKALQLRAVRRVTELDRLTGDLEKERGRVESALDVRTRVLSHFAHQFRTPLSSLSGVVELLDGTAVTDDQREALAFAEHAAERLKSLVEEALAEAEGAGETVSLFPAPTELVQLLMQGRTFWRKVCEDTGQSDALEFAWDASLPDYVIVDAVRLRELIDCLVGYGVETDASARLLVNWDGGLHLTLVGDAPQIIDSTLDLSSDPQLRRAHFLADAMNGSLKYTDEGVSGIRAFLPLDVSADRAAQLARLQKPGGGAPSVLLAEDTVSNREVIAALLKKMGCEVATASNGAEALEAAGDQTFDAILMDVQMPVMDGETAVRTLRAGHGPHSRIPVIGITAHSLQEERDRLLAAGMSTCLSKPVKEADIRSALVTALMAAQPSSDGSKLFDVERFRASFGALPEHFRERFLAAVETDLDTYGAGLKQGYSAGDEDMTDKQAHALKGVAANVGAIRLLEAIAAFREQPLDQAADEYQELSEQLTAVRDGCSELFAAVIAAQ